MFGRIRHTPTASALNSSHSHSFSAPFVTPPQLLKLRHLCGTHGARLASDLSSPLRLRRLAYVRYAQRSLERVETRVSLPLASPTEEGDALETPSEEARDKVYTVLSEWDDPNLETYLEKVNDVPSLRPTLPPTPCPHPYPPPLAPRPHPTPYLQPHKVNEPGGRIGTYREGSPAGMTLAAFFDEAEAPTEKEHADLREALHAFRKGVDEMLPGVYRWLEPGSLHCTVRALDS